ncbi:hypothetical protein [Pseudomonas sp. RIT-PI-AD]|uniref:hypothetical protein n=1 Tax=Pseudomonas sp. RIT-PI-AD TaxID=3035294 RepID=UPI0021DB2C60|nr:hypothetical protein [Pseudomonas sp. RIT-PI-AD]
MKKVLIMLTVLSVLTGCSSTNVVGDGDFFSLSSRNVVYRDLTRPVGFDNEPEQANYVVLPVFTK